MIYGAYAFSPVFVLCSTHNGRNVLNNVLIALLTSSQRLHASFAPGTIGDLENPGSPQLVSPHGM